jgi:chromosome segregation protein
MFLKNIEIQGFKSFAERVKIDFGPGITVIVGPNGCGKSNLTEAVQWVLGEQNARALRGYRMDDVIFAGTSRRRSHGMAEVTLLFSNSGGDLPLEYEEVSITRRAYRSGEGEYFINKKPCRLRDIQEMFVSCGINRAAFSIVAQGKIEEFISQRPEERRLYLEEIAGISKYRQRKADAAGKLNETEQALVRLQDLLGELDRQLAPLAEQAQIANLYNECQDTLRELEARLVASQFAKAAARKNTIASNITDLQTSKEAAQARAGMLADELKELETALKERQEQIGVRELEQDQIREQLQELQISSARMEEKYASSLSRQAELQGRINVIAQKDQEIGSEKEQVAQQQGQCQEKRDLAEKQCLNIEREVGSLEEVRRQANAEWEKNNGELFEALHQKTLLASQVKELQGKKESVKRQQDNLKQKSSENAVRIEQIREQAGQKSQFLSEKTAALERVAAELEQAQQKASGLGKEQERIVPAIQKLIQENERCRTRLHMLQESEKNREGYQRGVRAVIQARDRGEEFCSGISGLVEDLFSIAREYETALYTALGRAAQYFVCDSPEVAQGALTFLKKQEAGRASFLPLTALQRWMEKERPRKVVHGPEILGRGADLVSCADQYRNVAEFLLGRTFFASTLRDARQFAEANYYRVRVVTLDGDLIQPGGLITGGREAQQTQFSIKRRQEIALLSERLSRSQSTLEELEARRAALAAEQNSIAARSRELEEARRSLEKERTALEQAVSSLDRELQQLDEFAQVWMLESNEESYRWGDLDQEIERSEKELAMVLESEAALEQRRAQVEQERADCDGKLHELNSRLSESRVHLVSLNQEIRYLEQKAQQVNNLVLEQQRDREQVEADMASLQAEVSGFEEQRASCRSRLEALSGRQSAGESDLDFRRRQVRARENYYHAKEKRCLKLKQLGWQREQRAHNLELQAQHLEEQLDEIRARALELDLDLDRIMEGEGGGEIDRPEEMRIKEQAASMRDRLAGFGEVNFAAPGEYAELSERHEFLTKQRGDMEDGRQALLDVIREMDQIVTNRFRQTFAAVKQNFESIFTSLFDGGTAELFLTDEHDLMNTGIDVRVVPRGKKPRHLSLLSGGEKALTGIAFLFALLRTSPSPFYFLDEIEAFLDESNLVRFSDYLCTMADRAQIILISHRPRTMQVADTLYGITMEEPGVSKLVAVDLVERKIARQPEQAG